MYLHSQGVAHRDLKPENIIVDAETQTVKIVDFGFAGVLDPSDEEPTGLTTPTGGTPGYKAPD
jgi:serine/threonine protein kinase